MILDQLLKLSKTQNAPKKILRDENGKVIGVTTDMGE